MTEAARPAEFTVEVAGATTVVTARGELDLAVREELATLLEPLRDLVVVDLVGVTFIDSSCIGALAGAATRLRAEGGDLRLQAPGAAPRLVLEMTGLGDWIDDPD
jgi:anti-anti-sigma factor